MFAMLMKETRPAAFYALISSAFVLGSIALMVPVIITWLETGLVERIPTAIVATGMMVIAFLLMSCGLILDSVCRARVEQKRILFLGVPKLGVQ